MVNCPVVNVAALPTTFDFLLSLYHVKDVAGMLEEAISVPVCPAHILSLVVCKSGYGTIATCTDLLMMQPLIVAVT